MTRAETIAAFKRRIEGENSGPRKCWNCGDHKPRADCIRRAAERKSREVTQ